MLCLLEYGYLLCEATQDESAELSLNAHSVLYFPLENNTRNSAPMQSTS